MSIVSVCLVCNSNFVSPLALQHQLPGFSFVCFGFVGRSCFADKPKQGEGWTTANKFKPPPPVPVISLLAVPRRLFCFGSLVILDVAYCYLWLFSLYINIINR